MPELLSRPALEVAPALLGARVTANGVTVRLTEVEAYAGPDDPGSHAYRRTPRSAIMYGPPGVLYCYLVYGLHVCANVVTGPAGAAGAVLLRSGEVVAGEHQARVRRPGVGVEALARGPANLCRSLALTLDDNGRDLTSGPVTLTAPTTLASHPSRGPRVGLRHAADRPWRFWLTGDRTVSAYRPASALGREPEPS